MRAFIVGLFWYAYALHASAGTFSLQIGNVTWSGSPGGYSCFNSTEYPNTVNFTITKTSDGIRFYAVTAGPSATPGNYSRQMASGPNRLNYQLYTSSARSYVLEAPPAANSSEVISGISFAAYGTVIPLSFTFYIPPGQLVPAGTYTDQVSVRIYRFYNDTAAPQDSRTVTITAVVVPAAVLSVVPAGSGFSSSTSQDLDFGELTLGESLGCDLLIKKNTGCNITFSSLNRGVMKGIPTPTADAVPYACTVNSSLINLATPALVTLPSGVSPAPNGVRLPVSITVGDPSNAAAGDYQDEITITVVAL
jgi:spore coat protein U-like protein